MAKMICQAQGREQIEIYKQAIGDSIGKKLIIPEILRSKIHFNDKKVTTEFDFSYKELIAANNRYLRLALEFGYKNMRYQYAHLNLIHYLSNQLSF